MVQISISEKLQLNRLQEFQKGLDPKGALMYERLSRIGNLVSARARLNITRQRLIDTGNLRQRTGYKIEERRGRLELQVGVFGVPYAGVHEYGFQGNVNVKSHLRIINKAFGKSTPATEVSVRGHSRSVNIRPRPYLRPAIRESEGDIRRILGGG